MPCIHLRQNNHGGGVSHRCRASQAHHGRKAAQKKKGYAELSPSGDKHFSLIRLRSRRQARHACPSPSESPSAALPRRLTELHSSGVTKDPASRDCHHHNCPGGLEICHRLIAVLIRPRLRRQIEHGIPTSALRTKARVEFFSSIESIADFAGSLLSRMGP